MCGRYFSSGSFCAIYWIKKRGLLPGLTFSNELISRDEGLHTEFAVNLYHTYANKLHASTIHEIIQSAVERVTEFICYALPCSLIGMNAKDMTQYISVCSRPIGGSARCSETVTRTNAFDFMELISLEGKTNFFEKKVS
jgi:ribonucleotide reductase beta subunit family protein with ferritin-like domain